MDDVAVLGPLVLGGVASTPGSAKERAILELLAVRAPVPVSDGELVGALWGDDPPVTATKTLQSLVSRLRRSVPELPVERVGDGYRLQIDPDLVDARRFEDLVSAGRRALDAGDAAGAAELLSAARALWRGSPVPELAAGAAAAEAVRLEELLRGAVEDLADARLAMGEHASVIGELQAAVSAEPLRERRWAQLMLALYRNGRRVEALRASQRAREVLKGLGLEPGSELVELERSVATDDPALRHSPAVVAQRSIGLATFLLTDIEGSTLLWDRQEGEMAAALVRHDQLIGDAVAACRGRLRKTRGEGDSTFSVFPLASDAIAAAAAIQRAVAAEAWPTPTPVRVRIGVHTGEAELRDGDHYGPAVNRAARLRSAASGGQTLVSGATAALTEGARADGLSLVNLGAHALPGLRSPIDVFELVVPDVAPLRGRRDRPEPRLPTWLTSFVGRDDERRSLAKRLAESRLVTVTGPGGVGKTRVAVTVASEISARVHDGVWFVDLAGVGNSDGVPAATAAALGVKDDPVRGVLAALAAHCAPLDALIVFDNCEHVIDGAADVVRHLLVESPDLRVLATSREPLGVPGETVVPLRPLPSPASGTDDTVELAAADAVRLFVDRASAISADFALDATNAPAVASLCRRLDGLPLAIELAAAQVDVLAPAQIERRLGEAAVLRSSERGGVARHRSLDSVLDWSYDLLDEADRLLLDRLAVFRGTSSLEAIEAVVADERVATSEVLEVLARLVRRSLVVATGAGADRRYRLLETVREHSRRRLTRAGELDTWRNRHHDWVLTLASAAAVGVSGGEQHGQAHWFAVLEEDIDNLEEALAWSALDPFRAERALPAVIGLFNYWIAGGTRRAQGVRFCSTLADAASTMAPSTRAEAYLSACFLAVMSDLAAGEALALRAELLADRTGDERASATAAVASGLVAVMKGDVHAVRAHTARRADLLDGFTRILADHNVGWLRSLEGANDEAYELLMNVVARIAELGDEHMSYGIGNTAVDVGAAAGLDTEQLSAYCREALAFARRFPCAACESEALASLVLVHDCDNLGGHVAVARRAVFLAHDIRMTVHVMLNLDVLVGALAAAGDVEKAAFLAGGTGALQERTRYDRCLPGRRRALETGIDMARTALGSNEFDRLWSSGRQLGYDELVAAALDEQARPS